MSTNTIKVGASVPGNKSTATEAQRRRILEVLRIRPHTSYDLRRLGIYQAPTRIKELRDRGYHITTDPVVVVDRDGYHHARVALYTLVSSLWRPWNERP